MKTKTDLFIFYTKERTINWSFRFCFPPVYYLQPGFSVFSKLLPIHWTVILGQPVTEQYGSTERLLLVDTGEMFQGYHVHILICPVTFLIFYQSV